MDALIALLGEPLDSVAVQAWRSGWRSQEPDVIDWSDEGERHAFLGSKPDGILLKHSDERRIQTIFLMSEGRDGYSQYRGDLGLGLSFSSLPRDVLAALGPPSLARAPGAGIFGDANGEIMRFDYPGHSVAVQFRPDGRGIEMITIMSAVSTPGRR